MWIKTIPIHVQKFKSFVYGEVRLLKTSGQPILGVDVHERSNSKVLCSVCGYPVPGYDRQCKRRFEFIPFWGIKVFLLYAPRRVMSVRTLLVSF